MNEYIIKAAAFIFSQSVAANIELESMKAANRERQANGEADAYGEEQIRELISEYGLGCNSVEAYFRMHQ